MELFETEMLSTIDIVPDDSINNESDTTLTDPYILAGGGVESSTPADNIPDAINLEETDTVPSTQTPSNEETPSIEQEPETIPALTGGSDIEQNLNDIYVLLQERIPERSIESESESESESEQIELQTENQTLLDIKDEISNIREYESEQLSLIDSINNNLVVLGNNSSTYNNFILSGIMTIWGSFIVYLIFRKIG